jgi:CRP/FNR family transcriptional regulator, cyclic AMP receptor protein
MEIPQPLQEMIGKFRHVSLFQAFKNDNDALIQIARLFSTVRYGAGSSVVTEGEEGNTLYIIKSGAVEIVKKTVQGDSYTVAELSADNHMFFGEMALVDEDTRSASVVCKTACEFYLLTRDVFFRLSETRPELGLAITREIAKIICRRLRKANGDIITLFDALVGEVVESGGLG